MIGTVTRRPKNTYETRHSTFIGNVLSNSKYIVALPLTMKSHHITTHIHIANFLGFIQIKQMTIDWLNMCCPLKTHTKNKSLLSVIEFQHFGQFQNFNHLTWTSAPNFKVEISLLCTARIACFWWKKKSASNDDNLKLEGQRWFHLYLEKSYLAANWWVQWFAFEIP